MLTQIIEEAARWKREVAAGNLSPESIERLKKEGVAKTPEQYAAGLRKGSENIIKKAGFKLDTSSADVTKNTRDSIDLLHHGGFYTDPSRNIVRAPNQIKGKIDTPINFNNSLEKELALRHEANEAKYINKLRQNSASNTPIFRAKFGLENGKGGDHASMNIIADEARDVNFYNNLFGAGENIKKLRNDVEDKILQNKFGISYNDINFDNLNKVKHQINKYEEKVIEPQRLQRENKLNKILNDPNLSNEEFYKNLDQINSDFNSWTNNKTAQEEIRQNSQRPINYPKRPNSNIQTNPSINPQLNNQNNLNQNINYKKETPTGFAVLNNILLNPNKNPEKFLPNELDRYYYSTFNSNRYNPYEYFDYMNYEPYAYEDPRMHAIKNFAKGSLGLGAAYELFHLL